MIKDNEKAIQHLLSNQKISGLICGLGRMEIGIADYFNDVSSAKKFPSNEDGLILLVRGVEKDICKLKNMFYLYN